jgi:prolyl 4-hydroxylase
MFSCYIEPKVFKNFLTKEQCDFLINCEGDVFDFKKTQFGEPDEKNNFEYVNSTTKRISLELGLPIIKICSDKMNIPINKFDGISIIKYEKGGFIPTHKDSGVFTPRPYTFLLYLNDDYEGGETCFPMLNKSFKLNTGDALFFHNRDSSGFDTCTSSHEGKPVISGQKYVANIWVYDSKEYDI